MNEVAAFSDDGDLTFPVITISVSHDDLDEPVHVDLGSIPPFVAAAILEKVASVLKFAVPAPRITFKGNIIAEPFSSEMIDIDSLFLDGEEDDEQNQ